MNSFVTGVVVEKTKGQLYVDTKNTGKWDKIIECRSEYKVRSDRLQNQGISYHHIYSIIKVGDTVCFPVKLSAELLNNTYRVETSSIDGEPLVNGKKSMSIVLEKRLKQAIKQLFEDESYNIPGMVDFVKSAAQNAKDKQR
jgi:hypothetical protein